MSKKQRAVGLDMLKIISAIMIVVLHYVGYSDNLMINTARSYGLFAVSNLIEAFCICGVNVFVIISCYISIKSMKTSVESGVTRFASVWIQTIIVTVPLAVILLITGIASFSIKDILSAVLPFSTRAYWFITTFMCFNLLVPFLNRSVRALSSISLLYIASALVVIYCVFPTFFEMFGWKDVQHGYSLAWFVTLYYCTAFLAKSGLHKKVPTWGYACGYVILSILLFASVLVIGRIGFLSGYENYFIRNYASVPVFLQAFALFFTFEGIGFDKKVKHTKMISLLASGSLTSYVVHMHPLLKRFYIDAEINNIFPQDIFLYIIYCVVASVGVYLVSVCLHQALKRPIDMLTGYTAELTERIMIKLHKIIDVN